MSEDTKSISTDPAAVEQSTLETVDKCMSIVDNVCRENNFDASAMIFMSINVAAHLMARGMFFADGPNAREQLRTRMLDEVSEILDSARQHIDQSERELNQNGIIRPN